MDLIDRSKLPKYDGMALDALRVAYAVEKAETVDAVPVVHGHWVPFGYTTDTCSVCNNNTDRALMCCYGSPSTRYEQHPYCPWCGAKMTGDLIYGLETGEQIKDGDSDG